jgi:hypothetical protein
MKEQNKGMAVFEGSRIRSVDHDGQSWFAVVDVVAALTESKNPPVYWRVLKKRLLDEGATQTVTNCNGFKLKAADGKMRKTDCATKADMFRIIQSIPSPKAEPFKQWLGKVGAERLEELEDPELTIERMREDYRALGYPDEWISQRLQSIDIRKTLTQEWEKRGVEKGLEYSILTAEIARETFGVKPSEHKAKKGLKRENLRDHMTDLELIFTMLGEAGTTGKTKELDAFGFHENRVAAREGGAAAGKAREAFERESGQKVLSGSNRKNQIKEAKRIARLNGKKAEDDKP